MFLTNHKDNCKLLKASSSAPHIHHLDEESGSIPKSQLNKSSYISRITAISYTIIFQLDSYLKSPAFVISSLKIETNNLFNDFTLYRDHE